MSYVFAHWSLDPMVAICLVLTVLYERGLANLARRSVPARVRRRRRASYQWYGGVAALLVAVDSPIDYWGDRYFFVHMIEHVLLMFIAPMLLVGAAPWLPVAHGLPVRWRRRLGRALLLSAWSGPLRGIGRLLRSPWVGVALLNLDMVLWHVPALFNLAERNTMVHVVLMHGSFLVTGVLFWMELMDSHPFHPRLSLPAQIGAILTTNAVMFVLAMSMSIFTATSWYTVYDHLPGIRFSAFADQQLGAAILWICGDFWATPILIKVVRRVIDEEDGGISAMLEHLLHRAELPELGGTSRP